MIQTKTPTIYGDRDERQGIIKLEVRPQEMKKTGTKYLVIDWDATDSDNPIAWKSKEVFYDSEKINQLDAFIEATYDLSGMSKTQKEWFKVYVALMLDTQTNLLPTGKTIYRRNPEDWEFSPEVIEEFPILAPEPEE